MLDRHFEEMTIRANGRQRSQHEQSQTTLPRFSQIAAVAGQHEGLPPVARPRNYSGQSIQSPLYPGQALQCLTPHNSQVFTGHRQPYAYSSIESTPSIAVSSPRTVYNDHVYDTSSVSSSSRESSAYPGGSVSSSTTTTRVSRTTRTKRGSESQESNSDRGSKRATRSNTQSDLSDAELQNLYETCQVPFGSCRDPKNHVRKVKKIVKEKSARNDQAKVLQNLEDTLDIVCDWRSPKEQMPGNQKKSGLIGDKQHVLVSTSIHFDRAMAWIARYSDLNAFLADTRPIIDCHIAGTSSQDLPSCSLLAANTASDERCCRDDPSHRSCDNPIDCRKVTRRMQCQSNLGRCMGGSASRVQKRSPTTGASARTSLSRRH